MEVEYRHPTEADLEAITEVTNLSSREHKHHTDSTPDEVRTWFFGDSDFDPDGYLLAFADGLAVALGGSIISKSRQKGGFKDAYVGLSIIPEWRGKGIESHLMQFTLDYLKRKGISSAKMMAPEQKSWLNGFAKKSGMHDIRHGYLMVYDRKEPPLKSALPGGYICQHTRYEECSDAEIDEFVKAFNESFLDHWNFAPVPAERFIKIRDEDAKKGESVLRLTLVKKGGEIAGVCFYGISIQYNKQNNRNAGWTNILGVKKPHRRLGLGRALLSESMVWMREQGMDTLYLGMDAENSKALGLYTSQGYRTDQESITYELKL